MSSNREIIKEKLREIVLEVLTETLSASPGIEHKEALKYYTDLQTPKNVGTVTLYEDQLDFERAQCRGALKVFEESPDVLVPGAYTLIGKVLCLIQAYRDEHTKVGELESALQTSRELCDSLREDPRVRELQKELEVQKEILKGYRDDAGDSGHLPPF